MTKPLQIFCKNNKKSQNFEFGTPLSAIYSEFKPILTHEPLCAVVNNQLEGLSFRVFGSKQVEFLDITSPMARRVYMRSLTFVLYKALEDLCPGAKLNIEATACKGYFFTLLPPPEGAAMPRAAALLQRMREIVEADYHFSRQEAPTSEVVELFRSRGLEKKAKLLEGTGRLYSFYYKLCDTVDYYYGPLVLSTGVLKTFDLDDYEDGLLLRIPGEDGEIPAIVPQPKMLQVFRDTHRIQNIGRVTSVGEFNAVERKGLAGDVIKVAEAMQEKRISQIAEAIAHRSGVRVVLVAGPSSSGKTTFSKRLSVQLMTCGLMPRLISLDDYFVDRDHTPRDASGDYDYEHIEALDLDLFHQQLNELLQGGEVELPRYDFTTGKSVPSGTKISLGENSVLIMEGIHALNPLMSEGIPAESIFRVYVSALTSIKLDDHNYIPTTDNRLIRRIVRDSNYRGTSARQTIARWPSVRRGEDRWIFPYQENADAMFNSAMFYELAVLRGYALPLLEAVHEDCDEHVTAKALADFLRYFEPLSADELPPTSLLREFLGGSSFTY